MAEYRDPIIAKIIEKLEAEGPEILQGKYYYGDVAVVPKDELPICSVAIDRTAIRPADNMEDESLVPVVLNVLWDYTRDLTDSYDLVAGTNSLYDVCVGRDATYQYKANSIAFVLRKYETLDTNLWLAVGPGEQVEFDFGLGIERRGPGIFSVEAVCRFTAKVHKVKASLV